MSCHNFDLTCLCLDSHSRKRTLVTDTFVFNILLIFLSFLYVSVSFLENYPDSASKLPGFNGSDDNLRSDLSDEEDQNRSRRKRQKVSTADS